jgi:hypothetical protein
METMQEARTGPGVEKGQKTAAKLDPGAFGLACGTLWGLGLFSLTWWLIALDGSSHKRTALGRLYRGYTISPRGSVIGLVWGFFDALCGGACFAWLYNAFLGSKESR